MRMFLVAIAVFPATAYYGGRILWSSFRGRARTDPIVESAPRRWANLLLRLSGVQVEPENEAVIDPERPQILVANHASWYDILALMAHTPGRSVFVAKKEIQKLPIFGRIVRASGHIFIDRSDRKRAVESLAAAKQRLEEESPTVIMFPEGTRTSTGELQPFKKGAFVLALQTGVDIVPTAILGSREALKKGSLVIRPGTIRVVYGEPIPVSGLDIEDRNELTEQTRTALAGLLAAR